MTAIQIRLRAVERRVQMVETRMPFRYGAARLLRCPHLYVVATIEDEQGRMASGIAADNLPPQWFDKDAAKSHAQEVAEQLQALDWAIQVAQVEAMQTPFSWWLAVYGATQQVAQRAGLPPLLAGFGVSLLERAVLDAVGRLLELPFHALLQSDFLGVQLETADASLQGITLRQVLPAAPLSWVEVRHTIGLSDPIRTSDIDAARVSDGLPQSLEEVIAFYGVRGFKIKIANRLNEDVARLSSIARVLDKCFLDNDYFCTLDGNEQYASLDEMRPLLEEMQGTAQLRRLAASIRFIEQPLARAWALDAGRCNGIENLTAQYPLIIDESDDSLNAARRALELGYSGTSHKNCKTVFKSLLNRARLEHWRQQSGRARILSAEDLTTIGSIALAQDLTVLSALGIAHAERNGHHYFRGLAHLSAPDQERVWREHPDLYVRDGDVVRLDVRDGRIACGGLHRVSGLGAAAWPSWDGCTPVEQFDPFAAL